ncbi:MAG: DUF459 domain-containing protein [Sulfobacillus acidophilus]|uniref:DUF459 domain-containing protein n=1 Tax=Sulfobacillus acidophilus TaxID=53633 RepID=A0A2T2WEB3_9FIRM|nr:MAG: DUF459 domain-containing protein [Sulfobacillus acidophilus]
MLKMLPWAVRVMTLGAVLLGAVGCQSISASASVKTSPVTPMSAHASLRPKRHRRITPRSKSPHHPITFASDALSLPEPSPSHPLKILVIGDSLGEDLQDGLIDIAGPSSAITVIPAAVGSTGLANVAYYNWPKVLEQDLTRDHPQVVIILIGGNDAVGFLQNGQPVEFGTALWRADYGDRVASIIRESRQAGADIVWVGLPLMAQGSVLPNSYMHELNAVYAAQVARNPGVATFIPTWSLFRTPNGQFAEYLTDSQGQSVMVRDPDGVHIAPPAGQELIAAYVLSHLTHLAHISVCLNGSNLWAQYSFPHCRNSSQQG